MYNSIIVGLFCLCSTQAFWGKSAYPDWDELRVRFMSFDKLPETEEDAVLQGWTQNGNGCLGGKYKGKRYILNGESATMVLYSHYGRVAGVQMAVPSTFEISKKQPGAFIREGNTWLLTAYFTNPDSICNGSINVENGYVGNQLYLVMHHGPVAIPLKENDVGKTSWTKGKCFFGMGQHYWYNVSKEMDCDYYQPFFLLYNGGELNGFGFATIGWLESPRVEHPAQRDIKYFFQEKPTCIEKYPKLTTQHFYLQRRPWLNLC